MHVVLLLPVILILNFPSHITSLPVNRILLEKEIQQQLTPEDIEKLRAIQAKRMFDEEVQLVTINDPAEREKRRNEKKVLANSPIEHDKMMLPGSGPQLKEVWRKADHMDPHTISAVHLFRLHDLDNNGEIDIHEIRAFVQPTLDNAYIDDENSQLKVLDQHRMVKLLLDEYDTNKDRMISFEEFTRGYDALEYIQDEFVPLIDMELPELKNHVSDKFLLEYATKMVKDYPDNEVYGSILAQLTGAAGGANMFAQGQQQFQPPQQQFQDHQQVPPPQQQQQQFQQQQQVPVPQQVPPPHQQHQFQQQQQVPVPQQVQQQQQVPPPQQQHQFQQQQQVPSSQQQFQQQQEVPPPPQHQQALPSEQQFQQQVPQKQHPSQQPSVQQQIPQQQQALPPQEQQFQQQQPPAHQQL